MKRVEELSNSKQLMERKEWYSEWVKVDTHELFKLCILADVMLSTEIQFSSSEDKEKPVMTKVTIKSASKLWKYVCKHVKLPYCRLKIENSTSILNNELSVTFLLTKPVQKHVHFEPPKHEPPKLELPKEESHHECETDITDTSECLSLDITKTPSMGAIGNSGEKEKRRFSSPFHKRPHVHLRKLSAPPEKKIPVKDHRLPDFIPKGSILIGDTASNIKMLPIGLPDQVLTATPDGLEWKFPFPPKG